MHEPTSRARPRPRASVARRCVVVIFLRNSRGAEGRTAAFPSVAPPQAEADWQAIDEARQRLAGKLEPLTELRTSVKFLDPKQVTDAVDMLQLNSIKVFVDDMAKAAPNDREEVLAVVRDWTPALLAMVPAQEPQSLSQGQAEQVLQSDRVCGPL